jgi:hypothetical protein
MLIRTLAAVVVLAIAAPAFASVPSDRLSDTAYLRLSRCVAYATVPAIADEKSAALAERVSHEAADRPAVVAAQAAQQTAWIQQSYRNPEKLAALKAQRDRVCKGV